MRVEVEDKSRSGGQESKWRTRVEVDQRLEVEKKVKS
jgi:hypothetical protein